MGFDEFGQSTILLDSSQRPHQREVVPLTSEETAMFCAFVEQPTLSDLRPTSKPPSGRITTQVSESATPVERSIRDWSEGQRHVTYKKGTLPFHPPPSSHRPPGASSSAFCTIRPASASASTASRQGSSTTGKLIGEEHIQRKDVRVALEKFSGQLAVLSKDDALNHQRGAECSTRQALPPAIHKAVKVHRMEEDHVSVATLWAPQPRCPSPLTSRVLKKQPKKNIAL
jgi:hypothetical protein